MNKATILLTLILVLILNACNTIKRGITASDSTTNESPYLNQKPPGLIPEMFAPGIFNRMTMETGKSQRFHFG
ncbi:MAG: hypothetical protein V3U92_13170 [Cellulophaga sp.]